MSRLYGAIFMAAVCLLPRDHALSGDFGPGLGLLNEGARAIDRGEVAKGMNLTNRALDSHELGPLNIAAAYNNLCIAYTRIRRFDEALDLCDKALKLVGTDWRFYNNRGNVYLGKGLLDEAIADYRRALHMNPDSATLNSNLRLALERKDLGLSGPPWPERGA